MAGPRKAEFVSIPMGPGVLTNTTGRGAKTRVAYMNFDRWKFSNWVRWHKLLAEKLGGWIYQNLTEAGNPVFNPLAPVLWLPFNGGAGSQSTTDESSFAWPVTINPGFPTVLIEDATPHFPGDAYLQVPVLDPLESFALSVPLTYGSALDVFAGGTWTIEAFVRCTSVTESFAFPWMSYAAGTGIGAGGTFNGFTSVLLDEQNGTVIFVTDGSGAFTTAATISQTYTGQTAGAWHHLAIANDGTTTRCFFDGQLLTQTTNSWTPAHYTPNPPAGNSHVVIGSQVQDSGVQQAGDVEQFLVFNYCLYTSSFTPPSIPYGNSNTTPVLLLHFDGSNGQTTTVDSSVFGNPMTFGGLGATLSTSDPKFGTAALLTTLSSPLNNYAVATEAYAAGTTLDVLALPAWTISCWVNLLDAAGPGGEAVILDYGGSLVGTGQSNLLIRARVDVANTTFTAILENFSAYPSFAGSTISGSAAGGTGTWHFVAVALSAGVISLYIDGVLASTANWAASLSNYVYAGTPHVVIGSFGQSSAVFSRAMIDEVVVTQAALYTANFTPPTAPTPAQPPGSIVSALYLGLARGLHDWASIDGQFWIAIGTHVKLYVVNMGNLFDITPIRKTSNVVNPITTTATSDVVLITDTDHRANDGNYVDLVNSTSVGGLTLQGTYAITIVDPNSYTIVAYAPASASATGGGNMSILYEIYTGLPSNGELLGYGTSTYGADEYGTPRPVGTGVFARLRTWSLDNYGQDLVASDSDGEIYYWTRNSGPNSRATILPNAPEGCQRVLVDAAQRVVIALGCTDVTGAFDAMLIRWCSLDDITDWFPTDINTAGDYQLVNGSRIVTGLKTRGQNLILTDTSLYRMVFTGGTDVYDFYPAGDVEIVGPNAAVDVDGVAYLMGYDNFYNYSGTLNLQACDCWETVFDPNYLDPKTGLQTALLRTQSEKTVCYTYEPKTEITWLYPSIGGSGENDRYVTFNWEDGVWYFGAWNRTCAQGRAPAMQGYPYGVNAGYLYQHEVGTDAIEANGTFPLPFQMISLDITVGGAKSEYTMGGSDARFSIGGSDSHLRLASMIPDWAYFTGQMNLTISTKDRPQESTYVVEGPQEFDITVDQIDIDAHGSQIVITLDNLTDGGQPSLGCSFRMGIWQGLATPYAKR